MPSWRVFLLILVCMVTCRNAAMAFNRLAFFLSLNQDFSLADIAVSVIVLIGIGAPFH